MLRRRLVVGANVRKRTDRRDRGTHDARTMKFPPTTEATCPLCLTQMDRVHRHFADRCLSLFVPVARYRCAAAGCSWEGLFAPSLSRTQTRTSTRGPQAESYRPRSVLEPSRGAPRPNTERRAAR